MCMYDPYLDIPANVQKLIAEECKKLYASVVLVTRTSLIPEYSHAYYFIARKNNPKYEEPPYMVYLLNTRISLFENKRCNLSFCGALSCLTQYIH